MMGGLVIGVYVCLQVTRATPESFRIYGIHKYPRFPADSVNGGGFCSAVTQGKGFFSHCSHTIDIP